METLLSLIILVPVAAACALTVKSAASSLQSVKRGADEVYSLIRFTDIAERIMQDIDSHPFNITPVIHRNGLILYTDGSPNPVSAAAGDRAPSAEHDAVTSFRPAIRASRRVIFQETDGEFIKFLSCDRFSYATREEYRSMLAVHTGGFSELEVISPETKGPADNCLTSLLKPGKSMIASGPGPDSGRIYMLIPLSSAYSYYTDRSGTLRFLSHAGERNIENQPALENFPKLSLKAGADAEDLFSLGFVSQHGKERFIRAGVTSSLPRLAHYNFLLNRQYP